MTFIGQHSPATRATTCEYCGTSYIGDFCADCDLFSTFSDLFKDENGVRPRRWSNAAMREWIATRAERMEALYA